MSGLKRNCNRYENSLKKMKGPVLPGQLPEVKMDLAGLSRYAKAKGKSLESLSEEEFRRFVPLVETT